SASGSRPNWLSPTRAESRRPTSPCSRGDASGSSKLGTAGKRRCCAEAEKGERRREQTARRRENGERRRGRPFAIPFSLLPSPFSAVLDIGSLPSDVPRE